MPMPSATASGASTGGDSSSARSRDHKQGNQGRTYTVEQKAAVIRIRRCEATAFYDILGLESVKTTCTDGDVKKAYRKLSLLTHPDKNGHEHADEAFKMVSRAFGILGDKEKREKYDRYGTDPDSRFANAQAQNPFAGFASRQASAAGARGGWEEELSPEEMFARFFGGGGGFGGGPFGGPQFVFNFGGGPGIRVHQFGGARPRRRPREAQPGEEDQNGGLSNILAFLPIFFLFILPVLSSLFSGGGSSLSSTPPMVYDNPLYPYTTRRTTSNLHVPYFVDPSDVSSWSSSRLNQLDRTAEVNLVQALRAQCEEETVKKRQARSDAVGWFYQDPEKMAVADALEMPSCERLRTLGISR